MTSSAIRRSARFRRAWATRLFAAALALGAAGLVDGGRSAASAQGLSNFFRNLLGGGSGDEPAPQQGQGDFRRPDQAYCPIVDVFPGGAALQAYAGARGDASTLRHQLSLVDFARECALQPDGSIRVKVGVEGRAILGPAGGAGGRFEAPVRFDIKVGDKVIVSRGKRVPVTVTGSQGEFIAIEDLTVPRGVDEYEIEVGLGGLGASDRRQRQKRGG